jgi:hypothetical protein
MMNILLLLPQKMRTDSIQRIRPQFIIPLHNLQHIQLQPPIQLRLLRIPLSKSLARKCRALHDRFPGLDASEEGELVVEVAGAGAVDEVGQVKVCNVVAGDDVRVDLLDEIFPREEEAFLGFVGEDLGSDNLGARVDGEDVADEGFGRAFPSTDEQRGGTISCNDIGNLDDWIDRCLGEHTGSSGTFDIETEDPEGRNTSPFALRGMRHNLTIRNRTLNLTIRNLLRTLPDNILSRLQLNPIHPHNLQSARPPKSTLGFLPQYQS